MEHHRFIGQDGITLGGYSIHTLLDKSIIRAFHEGNGILALWVFEVDLFCTCITKSIHWYQKTVRYTRLHLRCSLLFALLAMKSCFLAKKGQPRFVRSVRLTHYFLSDL